MPTMAPPIKAPTPTTPPAPERQPVPAPRARRAAPTRSVAGGPAVRLGAAHRPGPPPPRLAGHAPAAAPVGAVTPAGPTTRVADARAARDPRMHAVLDRLDKSASRMKTHPPAGKKVAEAQAAAQPPANEKLAGAAAVQVDAMGHADTKKPEDSSFLTLLRSEIQKVIPKKTEGVQDFMAGDDRQQLKGAMTGNINQQKEEAAGGIKAASNQPPDPSKVPGKTVTPLPSAATPTAPAVGAVDAMPTPRSEADVSMQQGKQDANKALADADVTPTQLQKANDPRFSAVLTAKSAADQQADAAPAQYRSGEQKTLADATVKASGDERQGLAALTGQRGKSDHAVVARQLSAKEKDEARRKEVTDHIQSVYDKTKAAVDKKLDSLEADVSKMFDDGADAAIADMKKYIDDRFDDRYSGISGKALWLKDKLLPLPDAVSSWFGEARAAFLDALDKLVVRIANVVETRLKEAKDEIAKGQKEIHDYVEGLPKDLQAVGKAAEQEMRGRFDELRQGVDDRKNDLAQKLAQRYKDAYDKGDAALKEMKDAHKSLLQKLKDAIEEVIKVLRAFKERIMGMLKKGAETISLIVSDPIGFLKNLLNAVKQGLTQFVNNIWTHLKVGFMKWLFGTLAEAGIQIPTEFSLGAILKLVLQILGLTYDRIRAKAVKLIGERNVMLLEKAWELISALITGGPAALWEKIKEFLGNLKEMVIDALQNWVIETVIKSAITKLATMFNPVGAIIQAIITIYNTVMFFIERINQILDLVEAILNSVYKIATGDLSAAANWVEQALARTIPVIIGFLARLLGLGGLSDKIKSVIQKVQAVVDKAIDKLIEKIVAGIGKLFGKGKEKPDERTDEQKKADLDKGLAEADEALKDETLTDDALKKKLAAIQSKYRMTSLVLVTDTESETEETDHIEGEINPRGRSPDEKRSKKGGPWKLGDPVDKSDAEGNYPEWKTVRERYWMNRDKSGFAPSNRALMAAGFAPKVRIIARMRDSGQEVELLVTKEIHHIAGRTGKRPHAITNLMEVWPWEHEDVDSERHVDFDFVRFK